MSFLQNKSALSKVHPFVGWPFVIVFMLEMLQTSMLNSAAVLLLLAWLLLLCGKHFIDIVVKSFQSPSLLLFAIWGVMSLTWSLVPMASFILVSNEVAFFCLALLTAYHLVLHKKTIGESLRFSSIFLIILVTLYSIFFFGASNSPDGFKSFYHHKNGLGSVMALCFLVMLLTERRRLLDYALTVIAFIFLVLSQSKTPLNLVFITVGILGISKAIQHIFNNFNQYTQGFLLLATKPIAYLAYILIVLMVIFRVEISNYLIQIISDDLFSGRGLLWNAVLSRSQDNLLMGIGPGVFWGAGLASEIAQTQLYMYTWIQNLRAADGGYIDLIGSLGFIGLALIFMSYVQAFCLLFKMNHHQDAPLIFALLIYFIFHNITETDIYRFKDPLWYLYVSIYFYLIYISRNMRAEITHIHTYTQTNLIEKTQ